MMPNEDYARLKVKEAIQAGIKAQRINREIHSPQREKRNTAAGTPYSRFAIVLVVITLTLVGTFAAFTLF